MRTFWFTCILCISCSAFAQQYVPFPTDSARWQCHFSAFTWMCPSVPPHQYEYSFCGDTIISSVTYHKICSIGWTADASCYNPLTGYIGCIREDSNKHVYLRSPYYTNDVDSLLYDFNVQVGDTLRTLNNWCLSYVTMIDSVLIGSTYRKQYHISGEFSCGNIQRVIIEGIGSSSGLIEEFGQYEARHDLDCFSHYGQTLYPSPAISCSPLVAGLSSATETAAFTATPNPSLSSIMVSSPLLEDGADYTIRILNFSGQLVSVQGTSAANGSVTIERNGLPEGIYFAEVLRETQTLGRVKIILL